MIEPTESESKEELDRFCDAMLQIREEIRLVENGTITAEQSVPRSAPHTIDDITDDEWDRAYSRKTAVQPSLETRLAKFWLLFASSLLSLLADEDLGFGFNLDSQFKHVLKAFHFSLCLCSHKYYAHTQIAGHV